MDDIQMADDSSPSGSLPQQRFNIAAMLSESSRSTFDSISGALMASATADAASIGSSLSSGSVYYEKNDEVISQRLQTLYPYLDHKKDPLPRYWNANNKISPFLSVSSDYLRVQYKGKSGGQRSDAKDAAHVRANRPIPTLAIVYYFEIYIVNRDTNGVISIGLSDKIVPVNRIPGCDENSYGYHASEGNFIAHGNAGQKFGPKYTTGDVIGCGLNFITRELFFTKNGTFIGVATRDIRACDKLFPSVGMQMANEIIDANFGQMPFKFDISSYKEEAQRNIMKTIRNITLPSEKAIWINRTISGWLEHEGYSRALDAFNMTTGASSIYPGTTDGENKIGGDGSGTLPSTGDGSITRRSVVKHVQEVAANEEMENRRAISRLVQSGRTGEAIKEVERLYPTLLTSNKELNLLLKIQQYVEMIVDVAKELSSKNSANLMDLRNELCGLTGGPSTSSTANYGSHANLKRSTAPYCVENGRNALKRRSSEEDRDTHQSPRRFPNHGQGQNVSGNVLPSMRSTPNPAANPQMVGNSGEIPQNDEPMDIGRARDSEDAMSVTNGNSTNGCTAPCADDIGSPPTSTTIVEELGELNDVWDGGDDIESHENGYSAPEDFQHLQKYLPVIELGHSISQFSQQLTSSISSPKLLKRMNDAFSLIGYSDPVQCNNNYLLSQRERNFAAKALNKALLEQLGKERYSQIDLYIRKTRNDRRRAMSSSTSAIFADVDQLLFSRSPFANMMDTAAGSSNDGESMGEQPNAAMSASSYASAAVAEDENSNSSGGSSSLGAAGAYEPKV